MAQYITDAALNQARNQATVALVDTCQRLVHTPGGGTYGTGRPTYPAGVSESCLFQGVGREEAATQVERIDARLHLARDSAITNKDQVKITHLHGEAVANPQTYNIVSGPVLGHIGKVASLRLLTTGE